MRVNVCGLDLSVMFASKAAGTRSSVVADATSLLLG